jgi:hypothetical protein
LVSAFHAREMAWCASSQLTSFGECRWRFHFGVHPRCSLCPLFNAEPASRARLREQPAPAQAVEPGPGRADTANFHVITDLDFLFNPNLLAQLEWEIPRLDGPEPTRPRLPARRVGTTDW